MSKRYGRKLGKCICKYCGIEFEKPQSEINRNLKLNRNNFCSRTCVGNNHVNNLGDYKGNVDKILGMKRSCDEYTKFRYHFRNIKKRFKEVNVTIDDLKNQWEKQNGLCYFTGIELVLSSYGKIIKNQIYTASLDRIDSNKGYIKNNIRWVSRSINYMKNDMSDDMVYELFEIIKKTP